ncbi:MAG: tyrosine-type recombinase/integrase [Acidimicrobiales bacterium]
MLNTTVLAGAIPASPCQHVPLPRAPKSPQHILTIEQVEMLAREIENPPRRPAGSGAKSPAQDSYPEYGLLVRVAAYGGLRAGEIGALHRKRVDIDNNCLVVAESLADIDGQLIFGETKTYHQRRVSVPKSLMAQLIKHLDTIPDNPDQLVFTNLSGGPLRHAWFYKFHFKPATICIGVPDLRFHDLRHTCASLLIAQGVHPRVIQSRLDHSSITVTMDVYGHLFPSVDESASDLLDVAIRQVSNAI